MPDLQATASSPAYVHARSHVLAAVHVNPITVDRHNLFPRFGWRTPPSIGRGSHKISVMDVNPRAVPEMGVPESRILQSYGAHLDV